MALDIKQTTVALNTTTGLQNITISGFGTPKAAIVMLNYSDSGQDSTVSVSRMSYGFTDGVSNYQASFESNDSATTSSTRRSGDSSLGMLQLTNGATLANIVFNAWITDGIQINITTAFGTPSVYATVILLGGSDLLNVSVGAAQLTNGTSSTAISSLSFEPTIVNTIGVALNTIGNSSITVMSLGYSHNDGTAKNKGIIYHDNNNVGTSVVESYSATARCAGQIVSGAVTWTGHISSYAANGFTYTHDTNTGGDYVFYLAMELGAGIGVNIDLIDSPSTTGSFAKTGVGFQPNYLMLASAEGTNADAIQVTDADGFSVYSTDGTSESTHAGSSQDAVTTTNTASRVSTDLAFLHSGNAIATQGSLTSFDSDGYTLNITTLTAQKKWLQLAFGAASSGINVTPLTVNYDITALTADVNAPYDILAATTNYNINALAATVSFSGAIDVTALPANYNITALVATVAVSGDIDVISQPANISYAANNATVSLFGTIDVNASVTNYNIETHQAYVQNETISVECICGYEGVIVTSVSFSGIITGDMGLNGLIDDSDINRVGAIDNSDLAFKGGLCHCE